VLLIISKPFLTIENILKVEKKVLISKISTALPTRKTGWGTRINEGKGGTYPKFLAFSCLLRFERRCRKQNTVTDLRLKDFPALIL